MSKNKNPSPARRSALVAPAPEMEPRPACVGNVARVDGQGAVYVEFRGSLGRPTRALIASTAFSELASRASVLGQRVLLNFDGGDPRAPVVVAVVCDTLESAMPVERLLRAPRVKVVAEEHLELSCGKSSMRLDREGRLVLRAEDVVSRGVRSNKVKGGAVSIN